MNTLFNYLNSFFSFVTDDQDDIFPFLKNDETFYMISRRNILRYLKMFKFLEENTYLYDKFFKIKKVLPINSANGRIFLISLKDNVKSNESSEILVKIPLNVDESDSICYEYYVGLTLNSLRINHNTNHFALVYGKVNCGFDNRIDPYVDIDLSKIKLCDSTKDKKIHLVYEYIRNATTKSVHTFEQYIELLLIDKYSDAQKRKIEVDLIKLIIILMYTLQVAQDNLEFTHYDLHMSNVLIVQLNSPEKVRIKYNNKEMFIVTDVIPHIIDYGRSYVNPNRVKGDEEGEYKFTDIQLDKKFTTFKEYQETLFKKTDWVYTNKDKDLSFINDQLTKAVFKYVYKEDLYNDNDGKFYYIKNGERDYNLSDDIVSRDFKKMIIDNIYNKQSPEGSNYTDTDSGINVTRYNLGITSYKFNKKYDFYRFTRSVLDFLLQLDNLHYVDMWWDLDVQLETEYPFYDPNYFSLPCDYHISEINGISGVNPSKILNKWFESPGDIGEYLYKHIKYQDDISGLRVHHIGGGSKRKKTEKTIRSNKRTREMSDKDFTGDIEINIDNDLRLVYDKTLDNLHKKEYKKKEKFNRDVKYESIPRPNNKTK